MSSLDILLEMGFSQTKAENALAATGNLGVEQAMEWLLEHNDDVEVKEEAASATAFQQNLQEMESPTNVSEPAADQSEGNNDSSLEAKSLKCDDCGKLMKSDLEVEFHATKTGHVNYSESSEEIKPLSDEEKKDRVKRLEEKIKMRRLEKEAQEKREQIEREKERRRTGQEMSEAKKRLEEEELKRIVDQRKKEKMEEKMARQKILEKIEQDRQARREKFGGMVPPQDAANIPTPMPQPSASVNPVTQKKSYDQTRIQIRLPSGQVLTQTFGSKEQLAAVRLYVETNQTELGGGFTLMTTFPKQIFTDEDMERPLFDLGLVPSAVLIVTKIK